MTPPSLALTLLLSLGLVAAGAGCRTREVKPPPKDISAPPFTQLAEEQPRGLPPTESAERATPCDIPMATSPEALLTPEGVEGLQRALRREGLLGPTPEDDLDARTLEALRQYQRRAGLPATGLPDYASLRTLGLDPDEAFRDRARTACAGAGEGTGGGGAP